MKNFCSLTTAPYLDKLLCSIYSKMVYLILLFKWIINIIGFILIYTALFTYKGELNKINSKLEDWWIALDDVKSEEKGILNFLIRFVLFSARVLDAIYGAKLSTQTAAVAMAYSCSAILWAYNPTKLGINFIFITIFIYLGTISWTEQSTYIKIFVLLISSLFLIIGFPIVHNTHGWLFEILVGVVVVITSIGSDFLSISIIRYFLKKIASAKNIFFASSLLFIMTIIASSLVLVAPWTGLDQFLMAGWFNENSIEAFLEDIFVLLVASNLTTALPIIVYFLIAISILTHKILWPFLLRFVYSLISINLLEKRKQIFIAGIALIVAANPSLASNLIALIKQLSPIITK